MIQIKSTDKYILLSIFQADQICYAVLCVFSYLAAGMEERKQIQQQQQQYLNQPSVSGNQAMPQGSSGSSQTGSPRHH